MISPPYLGAGDRVKIISTARKIAESELQFATDLFKSWGLVVEFGDNLFKEEHQFAGSKNERLSDLQEAVDDEDIKAIFCARGGYGTVQLIDEIDFTKFSKNPKWVVGYSDVTVLHCHLQETLGIESLHASMPINFESNSTKCLADLKNVLFGGQLSLEIPDNVLNRSGEAEGELVGGNLSILYSLNGSDSFPTTAGKILFIEDLDEYLYHIDRMMMNLKRSGSLSNLTGLIVGGMSDMNDNDVPFGKNAIEIIKSSVEEFDYPVCFDVPAGHIDNNRPLVMGRRYKLTVQANSAQLSF